ncbi:hypothetical protein AB0D12_39510 [Streptomyces sp. NPDC048479]|uniref:hypothetical protein n=1 Tax=Streptomyces sp. NPDC048479 TaxID=3154725 RepID=UPI00341A69D3
MRTDHAPAPGRVNSRQPSHRGSSAVGVIVIVLLRRYGDGDDPARTMEGVAPL